MVYYRFSIGDPITILTNKKHTEQPTFNSITEDINLDGSSAYFTSTQQIPIEVSSQNNYLSYTTPPTTPNQYNGEQIILNSGRLLFNSTQDHILLSSKKSINLNTVESVNIDAATQTVIQTPELYLGGIETAQPVVLGNDLVDLLANILNDLSFLTGALQNQLGVPVGTPIGPTNLVAQAINDKIGGYKAELSNILSQYNKNSIMIDPKKVIEQRKQKVQLKKDRVEQSELTSTDIEGINNAVTEDQKPKGLQKLGSLVLKQSQKLSKFVIPLAFNLIKEYGIDKLETALEEESDNIDELREKLKEEFCNVQLPQIIAKRNNAVDYLNNTGKILDSFTIGVNFGASFAGILEDLIKILKGASFSINQASKTHPLNPRCCCFSC